MNDNEISNTYRRKHNYQRGFLPLGHLKHLKTVHIPYNQHPSVNIVYSRIQHLVCNIHMLQVGLEVIRDKDLPIKITKTVVSKIFNR